MRRYRKSAAPGRFLLRRLPAALAGLLLLAFPALATPALVVDVESEAVLYAEDAGRPWYPASTAKLMTVFLTFEALRAGEIRLDTPVVMSQQALKQESLKAGLKVGRAMTLEDALYAVIAGSANEVSVALAETIAGSESAFVARMNDAAARLGMGASRFSNPNGLFARAQQVSARDLAVLGIAIHRDFPEYAHFFRAAGIVVDGQRVESNNVLLTRFSGTIGMKTGFVCAAGRNIVALAERAGRRVMVVLLGATTERERAERAAQLLTQAFAGELRPSGVSLRNLPGNGAGRPEDMRQKLCSDRSAAYETARQKLYPMGLPGEASYLGPQTGGEIRTIATWNAPAAARPAAQKASGNLPANIPIPRQRPAR